MDAVANYLTEKLTTTKNNLVETGSLAGYYGSATFTNNSSSKAELYAASCGITESSK